ncbi:hypothetical protein D3C83_185330 [compost metagenome]
MFPGTVPFIFAFVPFLIGIKMLPLFGVPVKLTVWVCFAPDEGNEAGALAIIPTVGSIAVVVATCVHVPFPLATVGVYL